MFIGGCKSGAYDAGDNMSTKSVYDAGAQSTTTTSFSYNNANELTSSTTSGTTTNYAYDAWGRQTSKTQGDYSCTYAYRYGDKLYSVTSNFPNEGNVTYQYGADQKRRERTAGGTTTNYRWDLGWNMINQENSEGTLTMTYVTDGPLAEVAGILADLSGTNPATGTARYYLHDNLGSTRRLRDVNKSSLGVYEYEPYGSIYAQSGVSLGDLGGSFTGKPWDSTAQLYYFPYRYYAPDLARWLTRDPLGMADGPNVYVYIRANPILRIDAVGRKITIDDCLEVYNDCTRTAKSLWYRELALNWAVSTLLMIGCTILTAVTVGTGVMITLTCLFGDVVLTIPGYMEATCEYAERLETCETLKERCLKHVGIL